MFDSSSALREDQDHENSLKGKTASRDSEGTRGDINLLMYDSGVKRNKGTSFWWIPGLQRAEKGSLA